MHLYYVVDKDEYVCEWDTVDQRFKPTAINYESMTAEQKRQYVREIYLR